MINIVDLRAGPFSLCQVIIWQCDNPGLVTGCLKLVWACTVSIDFHLIPTFPHTQYIEQGMACLVFPVSSFKSLKCSLLPPVPCPFPNICFVPHPTEKECRIAVRAPCVCVHQKPPYGLFNLLRALGCKIYNWGLESQCFPRFRLGNIEILGEH